MTSIIWSQDAESTKMEELSVQIMAGRTTSVANEAICVCVKRFKSIQLIKLIEAVIVNEDDVAVFVDFVEAKKSGEWIHHRFVVHVGSRTQRRRID